MERAIIARGRLSGPRRIDLDEAVEDVTGDVEVVVRSLGSKPLGSRRRVLDVIRSLPPGTRSKEDIDHQLAEERASWEIRDAPRARLVGAHLFGKRLGCRL